jgi:hypothetical protein
MSIFWDKVNKQVHEFNKIPPNQCRTVHIEYASPLCARWEVETTCCDGKFQWIIDLHPGGADVTPKNIQIQNFYNLFTLTKLPTLQSWSPNNIYGLVEVTSEIRDTFNAIQLELLRHHPNKRYIQTTFCFCQTIQ